MEVTVCDLQSGPENGLAPTAVRLHRTGRGDAFQCPPQQARKIESLEKKYDSQFKAVVDAIRKLMAPPPEPPRGKFGFARDLPD